MSNQTDSSPHSGPWQNPRIAAIGGGGFVGARLVALGRQEGSYTVVPVIRTFRSLARLGDAVSDVLILNTQDSRTLATGLRGFDAVVNVSSGDELRIEEDVQPIFEACRLAGVKRLVHISSAVVFGRVTNPECDDDTRANTRSWRLYARGKARAEEWLRERMDKEGPAIVVLRPGLIWGPGSNWSRMVGDQLWQGTAILSNNGNGIANLVYVDNLVRMILAVATATSGPSGFYNVADRETVTWGEYYRALADKLGYGPTAVRLSAERRLRPSAGLVVEWCSQRPLLLRTVKSLPKCIRDLVKGILRGCTPTCPTPYGQLRDCPVEPLRLTRVDWELQNTIRKLPALKIFRDYGATVLVPFDQAVTTTAAWLRFAGFSPLTSSVVMDSKVP